ncbi:MAG TPA: NAD(P)/FAD-dependent oxidoreductase [Solirubrobacterales bacterium]|nr:NAD(P)/FAD-dependent oxidoreductase [Solirubrobacterales bacterium]
MTAKAGEYDVAIVGASLSGCTAAILLSRAGARVALIEKSPDPAAFKRVCSHFIQASAVPTIERIGLYGPILEAGGLRSRFHSRTPWGWIEPTEKREAYCLNLRRSLLDPMLRDAAAAEPGVDLMLGQSAERLLLDGDAFGGVGARDREGNEREIRARLVIGADGRDSRVAALAEVKEKTLPHNRLAYGGYFEGPKPRFWPDGAVWLLDPDMAAAFPTDGGQVFYIAMTHKDRAPEFKADPERALVEHVASVPDPPPIRESRCVAPVIGKVEMPNRVRGPIAPGLALIGDAALATDPIFGVGCGFAFQSGEWLADSVSPALRGIESLENGLRRYRKRHRRQLAMHARLIHDYSTGRKFDPIERLMMSTAVRDRGAAALFEEIGTRSKTPRQQLVPMARRIAAANARRLVSPRTG